MAVTQNLSTVSLAIEVKSGTDAKGNATYTKKSFSGVKTDATPENCYAVADAIKALLSVETRNYELIKSSSMISA